MALRDQVRTLADEARTEVLDLHDRFEGGGLSRSDFVASVAAAIARADGRAVTLADRSAALQIARTLGQEPDTAPTELEDQRPRLSQAVDTLLDERPQYATSAALLAASRRDRLGRLATNEPLQRSQEAFQGQLSQAQVGWTRGLGGDPCPLCEEWADGQVRPPEVSMPRHTGCACIQVPTAI